MGIFGTSSPFDEDVEKATSENNSREEWALMLEVVDRVAAGGANAARDCLRALLRRLAHPDPHVALQAATLLDACVANAGRPFLLAVASRDFDAEYRRVVAKAQPPVAKRLRRLLRRWASQECRSDPQLHIVRALYRELKVPHEDDEEDEPAPSVAAPASSAADKERDDLAKAIALSLQETSASSATPQPSLYPRVEDASSAASAQPTAAPVVARAVRALYDFEAAEDNELTFYAGETVHVTDETDPNWWKGYNRRGSGLFPANFVAEPSAEEPSAEELPSEAPQEEEEEPPLDEALLEHSLRLLGEASAEGAGPEEAALRHLEAKAMRVGQLVDQRLQRADARHAALTQLSADLVDALNLYHHLMRGPPTVALMQPPPPMPPHAHQPNMPHTFYGAPPQPH